MRGNSAADSAAKDALDGDISDEFIPFSDLKPRLNNYIFELWQREWDEYPRNKLHKILPKLTDRLPCPSRCLTRWEETALCRLHVSLICNSFILVEGRVQPFCVSCVPFHWNILYFPARIWLMSDKSTEGFVQRGFFGYHFQLFERD